MKRELLRACQLPVWEPERYYAARATRENLRLAPRAGQPCRVVTLADEASSALGEADGVAHGGSV
jgi:hypothetical protein